MKRVFISLFLLAVAMSCPSWAGTTTINSKEKLPFYDLVNKIIQSVEYSGFEVITKEDVHLKIDFNQRQWSLSNIHQYDSKGNILLEQGRYGLCAELSTYLYQELKNVITNRYELRFASATEAGFFPTYQSNHIVLLMYDKVDQGIYLMDPSFHKYGRVKDFREYQIFGIQDSLTFMKDQSADVKFFADQAMPLLIKEDLLLSFSVTSVDGKFDKNNFLLVVTVNRRNKISGLNMTVLGRYNGQIEYFESKELLQQFLTEKEIQNLHKKLNIWLLSN